jgi:hypothetical protein
MNLIYKNKERDQIFKYGEQKMRNYEDGLQKFATNAKLCEAVLKHSSNLETKSNVIFNNKTNEFEWKPKLMNDPFPDLTRFDWSQQYGVQVLIRIDTPIAKIRKIEAPSPTLSKKLFLKKDSSQDKNLGAKTFYPKSSSALSLSRHSQK